MAFGFPAHHSDRYSFKTDQVSDIHAIVRQSLAALSWNITGQTDRGITASAGFSLSSWNENVSIDFLSANSIRITSKCSLPTQCIDWGKNKANVEKFLAEIKKQI